MVVPIHGRIEERNGQETLHGGKRVKLEAVATETKTRTLGKLCLAVLASEAVVLPGARRVLKG
jgi:hypothetical protein